MAGFPTSYPSSHTNEPGDVSWGDVASGLAKAEIKIAQVYMTPIEHHNPMEPHATVANAIFHATGKRVRDLPITIDKLLT